MSPTCQDVLFSAEKARDIAYGSNIRALAKELNQQLDFFLTCSVVRSNEGIPNLPIFKENYTKTSTAVHLYAKDTQFQLVKYINRADQVSIDIMAYENVILIVIAAGIILFGAKKLPELARALGRAQSDYEKARREASQEIKQIRNQNGSVGREKLEEIADTLGIDYTNKNDDELRAAIDGELNKNKEKAKA